MGLTFGPSTSHPYYPTYLNDPRNFSVGDSFSGGFLICKAGGIGWVVSPRSAEVSRSWYGRGDATTTAQSVSGCTGWFIPSLTQLQNPGYTCRSFWGTSPCYSTTNYWSDFSHSAAHTKFVEFSSGNCSFMSKNTTACVRAFRCVTY